MTKRNLLAICIIFIVGLGCGEENSEEETLSPIPVEKVFAIVDVKTQNRNEAAPEGYTGVAFNHYSAPFIPDLIGELTKPSNVNTAIWWGAKYIWVKFQQLPVTSDTPVVVDMAALHWPDLVPDSPEGWDPAGPLTGNTATDCLPIGLAVKYLPLKETEDFIATVCLSSTEDNESNSCPRAIRAYGGYWARQVGGINIHQECGDNLYVFTSFYPVELKSKK